ncbi:MAG: hypothetical protein ACRDGQ_08745 [Candidatus Limnocylindrales bacterium]
MPDINALDYATPLALFAFAMFGIAFALNRRWWVPGWIYEQAMSRADKAEASLAAANQTIAALTAALREPLPRRHADP